MTKQTYLLAFRTDPIQYFEHLEHFCELLEPIIQDLRSKSFI